MTRRAKKVRRIARPPRSGGSSEATSERKNSSESRKMIGKANSSACGEVVADLRVDLRARDRAAAELDVALAGELALQALRVVLDSQVRLRLEVGDDIGRPSVAGDHRGVVAVVVARNGGDVATRAELRLDLPHAALSRCAVDVAGGHERDDAGVDLPSARGLVAIRRLDRLGRRVGVAIRAESFRDAQPEDAGYGDAEQGDEQHSSPVPIHE